jgi:Leucine-rich repeat (LRR) protein
LEKVTDLHIHTSTLTDVSTLARLKQLKRLHLQNNRNLTDVSALAGLTQLRFINLNNNPKLTKANIAKLQMALPDCDIVPKVTK